jgi:hypothetical protein
VFWGPHEDYMWKPGRDEDPEDNPHGKDSGWESRVLIEKWADFGWELGELNEVVNFYFSINRPARDCETCKGYGHHPDAQWVTESWYRHSSPFTKSDANELRAKAVLEQFGSRFNDSAVGRGTLPPNDVLARYGQPFLEHCVTTMENGGEWSTNLTQDEVDELVKEGRLSDFTREWVQGEGWKPTGHSPTAAEVNAKAKTSAMVHDAINSWICQRRRCERLGIPYECPTCEGHGKLFTGPAHLSLTLWALHPRKGASRGVEIKHVERGEVAKAVEFLQRAAERNAERFSRLPQWQPA